MHGLAAHKQDGEVGRALTIYNRHDVEDTQFETFLYLWEFGRCKCWQISHCQLALLSAWWGVNSMMAAA